MTTVSPDKDERRCSTCGATDPQENEFCSGGFHAPGETYWPTPDKDEVERICDAVEQFIENNVTTSAPLMLSERHDLEEYVRAAMSPVDRLREALAEAREAIASLDDDALGFMEVPPEADGETGYAYPIRDELLSHIDAALSSAEPMGEDIGQ